MYQFVYLISILLLQYTVIVKWDCQADKSKLQWDLLQMFYAPFRDAVIFILTYCVMKVKHSPEKKQQKQNTIITKNWTKRLQDTITVFRNQDQNQQFNDFTKYSQIQLNTVKQWYRTIKIHSALWFAGRLAIFRSIKFN